MYAGEYKAGRYGVQLSSLMKLVLSIVISLSAGAVGSAATAPAIASWYVHLEKPILTPPSWLFAPVWTALYIMMGVAMYLVWRRIDQRTGVREALFLFGAQLIINMAWPVVFFGLRSPDAGIVVILILWFIIYRTAWRFFDVSALAGVLLVPYLGWVSFAAYLNISIAVLNP